ncbi:MAG: SctK family type III secretion system sorting platform protein [Geminicoccaceae bacterium]
MTAERQSKAIPEAQGIPAPGQYRAQLRFERLPAAYCHPERIARLLPDGLPTTFRDRLQGSERLSHRLSDQLAELFALEPCTSEDLATPEGRFAALEDEELESALRRVGAIWHARTIRKIILAERLRELVVWLGRDNHRAALRFIDLAPEEPPGSDDGSDDDAPDLQVLMGRIERDGLMAVNAWCRHQPAALAERLRLKLPPGPETDDEPPATHIDRGLLIVDRVVMSLPSPSETKAGDDG